MTDPSPLSAAIPAPALPAAPVTPLDPVPAQSSPQNEPHNTLASLHIGQVMGGRYQLEQRLAIGGMGEVWSARLLSPSEKIPTDEEIALKILRPELAGEKIFLSRLQIEAINASKVSHPNLAQVYDSGQDDGLGWIAMELVDGVSLTQILEQEPILEIDFLLSVLDQTARALTAVHAAGIVHRDIKPGNIMVTPEGIVKLTDFGISKASNQVTLTAAGMVMGTAQYLPPEQAIGKAATPGGDLYALGIIAYEALIGERPFNGDRPVDIAFAHVKEPVPALPNHIPVAIQNLIYNLLEKDPEKRIKSAAKLVHLLTDLRIRAAKGELVGAAENGEKPAETTAPAPKNCDFVAEEPGPDQPRAEEVETAQSEKSPTVNAESSERIKKIATEADGSPVRFLSGGTVPAPEIMPPIFTVTPQLLHERAEKRFGFDQITQIDNAVSQVSANYTGAWPTSRRRKPATGLNLDQTFKRITKDWLPGRSDSIETAEKTSSSKNSPVGDWSELAGQIQTGASAPTVPRHQRATTRSSSKENTLPPAANPTVIKEWRERKLAAQADPSSLKKQYGSSRMQQRKPSCRHAQPETDFQQTHQATQAIWMILVGLLVFIATAIGYHYQHPQPPKPVVTQSTGSAVKPDTKSKTPHPTAKLIKTD